MVRYEIDENNAIHGYVPSQELPCLFQPYYPNGQAWSREEATAWAEQWVAELTAALEKENTETN